MKKKYHYIIGTPIFQTGPHFPKVDGSQDPIFKCLAPTLPLKYPNLFPIRVTDFINTLMQGWNDDQLLGHRKAIIMN